MNLIYIIKINNINSDRNNNNNKISYKMLEGTRLKYIIPGYTGHIPKKEEFDTNPAQKKEAHIPGYDGKVKSIKSENMYGQTFGKITGTVAKDE